MIGIKETIDNIKNRFACYDEHDMEAEITINRAEMMAMYRYIYELQQRPKHDLTTVQGREQEVIDNLKKAGL